ncbi:SDR family NAD(P)-dependent oxidoreductase [Candidatus Woesearchaeota archaeon]|nr:SDR family NAD(P)-dependent oxidoreductase [Candidatus Woesearchaeota archaeon]
MKILVTGGAGFIGSHTVDLLIENGYQVRVVDNLLQQVHQGRKPAYLNKKAEFVQGDVSEFSGWKKWLQDVDVVIHLASMAGLAQSMYEPRAYCNSNVMGTANFYETLVKEPELRKQVKKIIVASSKTIYGEGAYKCREHGMQYPELRTLQQLQKKDWELHCPVCNGTMEAVAIPEEKPAQNLSVYALTKYTTEKLALMFGSTLDIPTIAFRYFSVFGPRQSLSNPYTGVCSIFLSRIKNKQEPVVFEDGNQFRDFIFVEDVAQANLLAVKKGNKTSAYNVGSGIGTTINEVAKVEAELLGITVKPQVTHDFRYGDTRNDLSDNAKVHKDLGFKPQHSFKQGIQKLIEWGETQEAVDNFEKAESERKKLLGK